MIDGLPASAVLELAREPLLILDPDRIVHVANRAARDLFGPEIVGRDLADTDVEAQAQLSALLQRASRSTGSMPGVVLIPGKGSVGSRRVSARRISREHPFVGLEFRTLEEDRFKVLNQRIGDLDAEVRERSRATAGLEEALLQNQLLLRELQHRVKNTVLMLVGLLQGPARSGQQTYTELVTVATQRLLAVSRAHELMYREGDFRSVPAKAFLSSLVELLSAAFGSTASIRLDVQDEWAIPHDEAMAISLIVNELVTNAVKHGGHASGCVVSVTLERDEQGRRLTIRDNGQGLPGNAARESFGLQLVRGLSRQIGGRLELYNDAGAVCVIHMRVKTGEPT